MVSDCSIFSYRIYWCTLKIRMQKAINVSPCFYMFNQKWKCFNVILSVVLYYVVIAFTKSHFLIFSSGAARNRLAYSLLDEYIPRNFETLLRDFFCSQISLNCPNNAFGIRFQVLLLLFSTVLLQLLKISLKALEIMHRTTVGNAE